MSKQPQEPSGCLAFLFGFASYRPADNFGVAEPSFGEEASYHSGPGGYEGMGYSGGYAVDFHAEHDYFDEGGHEGDF